MKKQIREDTMLQNSIRESIGRMMSDCMRRLGSLWKRESSDAEWKALPDDERCKMAADVGTSSTDLSMAIREGAGSQELTTLIARPALQHLRYSAEVLRDMERVCTFCTRHNHCRSWQEEAGPVVRWPAFCPNSYTLSALQRSVSFDRI